MRWCRVIIFRYLARELYSSTAAVMLVLLLIFMSNQFIRYLAQAAAGKLGGGLLIKLMLLQIPHLMSILLPLAFYLAILLAYGRLYTDSELLILEANGFSRAKLLAFTLMLAVAIFIPATAFNLWLEPIIAKQKNTLLQQSGAAKAMLQTIMPGRFHASNQGRRIYYVEAISRDRTQMKNIFIADNSPFTNTDYDKKAEWWVVTAKSAYPEIDGKTGSTFLVLKDGHRYLGKPNSKDYQIVDFATYRFRLQTDETNITTSDVDAAKLTELWHNRTTDPVSAAEFHWRLAKSIAIFVLAILAIPLSYVNPRQGKYAKLLPAILLFILYFNMLLINQDWISKSILSSRTGMWPTHIVAALLGIILLMSSMGFFQRIRLWRTK